MNTDNEYASRVLQAVVDSIDIPDSYYERAVERYESLGKWMHRDESGIARHDPNVYAQGSFQYGTVIRPLLRSEEYDLDLVCQLDLRTNDLSQADLKKLVGSEVKAYAKANQIKHPVEEKRRCWRLDYADDVKFHMDILPAVPDPAFQLHLRLIMEVREDLASGGVAITDTDHPGYMEVQEDWPKSNPKGYAKWFEAKMKPVAKLLFEKRAEKTFYASIEDVPTYKWKTPLQRAIQILKRHRDVMFRDDPDGKPISMIITTLAALCYEGEADLGKAITNIVAKMPHWVGARPPRIPNPVQPEEDFADRWGEDTRLQENFWCWHSQLEADLSELTCPLDKDALSKVLSVRFGVTLGMEPLNALAKVGGASHVGKTRAPAIVVIKDPPRPWSRGV